jgi:uncharacterized membrane protein
MWFTIILIFIFLIVFIITGILITRSAVQIKKISGYSSDTKLQNAHKNATAGAVITWVIVGLSVILLVVGLFLGVDEEFVAVHAASGGGNGIFLYLLLGVLVILSVINGILAIITSEDIHSDPNYDPSDTATHNARSSAIWAAVLSFVSVGLLVIIYIFYAVNRRNQKKKAEEVRAETIANIISHSESGAVPV